MVQQPKQSLQLPQKSESISGRQTVLKSAPWVTPVSEPKRTPITPENGASKCEGVKDSGAS